MKRILFILLAEMALTAKAQSPDTSARIELIPGKVWGQRIRTAMTVAAISAASISLPVDSSAQAPTPAQFNTWVNSQRATVDANITTQTTPNSVGPLVVGGASDSAMHVADSGYHALYSAITSGCTCLLQNVLNNGNTATSTGGNTGSIILDDGTYKSIYAGGGLNVTDISSGISLLQAMSVSPTIGAVYFGNSGYGAILSASNLTGNRYYYIPDETGTVSTFNQSLVTHLTKNPIDVGSLSSYYTSYDINGLQIFNSTSYLCGFNSTGVTWFNPSAGAITSLTANTSGGNYLSMVDNISNNIDELITNPHSGTGDVIDTFSQTDGTLLVQQDSLNGTGGNFYVTPAQLNKAIISNTAIRKVMAQTGNVALINYTVPGTSADTFIYEIGGKLTINSGTGSVLTQVVNTNERNSSETNPLFAANGTVITSTITNVQGWPFANITVMALGGTTITVSTVISGTVGYDESVWVRQIMQL